MKRRSFLMALGLAPLAAAVKLPAAVAASGGGGTGANAFATVIDGAVTSVTVTSGGCGYGTNPIIVMTMKDWADRQRDVAIVADMVEA